MWEKTHQRNAGDEIRRPASTITRQTITWNPQGKRTPKKYVEKGSPDRHKEDRLQLEKKTRTEDFGRLLSMTYVPGGAKGERRS